MRLNFLEKLKAKLGNFKNRINFKKGFSLNDLSVMISTVLIVTATSVAITEIKTDSKKSELDSAKFERINKSLSKFLIQNKRLPCPAGLKIAKGLSVEYGKEQISGSNCIIDGTKGVFVSNNNSNLLYGAVPAQTLGLKLEDIEDQYGSKIAYVVNIKSTIAPSSDPNLVNENIGSAPTSIVIIEKSGDTTKQVDSEALYVLVSAGKNKEGAFNANSSAQNPITASASTEASNIPTAISGSTVTLDNIFVKSETKSSGSFDDQIFYKTKSAFLEESKAESVILCKNSGALYNNQNAFFGGIIYATQNCSGLSKRPAKKCGKDGQWTQEVSCPCSIATDGILGTKSVPNGSSGIKCDATNYSGILQYTCDELGTYTITETCKQSCTFQATGVSQVIVPYGSNKVDCNQSGYKGGYIITCNNGISAIQSGGCSDSKCASIGGSSGMKILSNVSSGTSSTFGICESGYTGSYSYSCENGISTVTDLCYQNCNFSLIGAETKTLTHGDSLVSCTTGYSGQGVSVNCNDGVILVKNNNCLKTDKCTVGVGAGMVSKEVLSDGILKLDGTCQAGYTGSYSYKCSSNGVSETTNNCISSTCVVGDQLGLTPKTVTKGTSGVDGQCATGYGGFYKWSCSSSGVGSVTENNCKNTCIVGGTNGTIQQVVGFGRTGADGLCDISQGYVGNYSWSCAVNASTGKVEGLVLSNSCQNSCAVGTSSQGTGMVQKSVSLNSVGQDGQCNSSSGYVGNYAWKCDFAGNSIVTTNNCKNSCEVGTSSQGVGMVQKTVSLNTSGTNGLCNDAQGYAGSYSWSCTTPLVNGITQAVGSVTLNNCQLRTCVVGGSSGMVSKTVNALTNGTNGTCQTGYYGSYSWSCSNAGVGSVTNNCVAITCTPPASLNLSVTSVSYTATATPTTCKSGFAYGSIQPTYTCTGTSQIGTFAITNSGTCSAITCSVPANITGFVSGTTGINFGTSNYFCNATGYRTDTTANFTCATNANSLTGTFTQNSNSCTKITCNASAVAGFSAKTVEHNTFVPTLPCDIAGYTGSLTNNCSTNNSTITPTGSCTPITCAISAGTGYSARTLNYGSSSFACDTAGYSGSISYNCNAQNTPNLSGSCSQINCPYGVFAHYAGEWGTLSFSSQYGTIKEIKFASYGSGIGGDPFGYTVGWCHASNSKSIVESVCLNQSSCSISASNGVFGDPCPGTVKGLLVQYRYEIPGINASTVPFGSGSISCSAGYSGSVTYNCTSDKQMTYTGGSCTPITCAIPAGTGYTARTLNYGSSSFACNTAGYSGTISYNCNAVNTPNLSGSCTPITCAIPAGTGYSARTLNYGSSSFACDVAGYTGTISYNCNAVNTPNLTGACTASPTTCTIGGTAGTSTVVVNKDTSGNGTCASGYTGYFSYSCNSSAVGSITVNNCYQGRTFVEKTFSFTSSAYSAGTSPGTWWGFEWPTNYTLVTPVDFVYATKSYFDYYLNYDCPVYGSYMYPSVFKRSGYGSSGAILNGYCGPAPCSSCSYNCPNGPVDLVGVDLRNGDIIGFSNGGYTGCGFSNSTFTTTITYMANPSCTVGGTAGTVAKTVLGGASGTDGTCSAGYIGSYSWSCGINGVGSITTNNCTPITCSIGAGTGYTARTLNYGSSSFACNTAGYSGTISYNCNAVNTPNLSGSCTPITCAISAGTGYSARTLNYGSGTFACDASGYTGTISYNCNAVNTPNLSGSCTASGGGGSAKIINPNFLGTYGPGGTASSSSLSGWTINSTSTTWSNEGFNAILWDVNSPIVCSSSALGYSYPVAAGFTSATVYITVTTPSPGYVINKFDWYGVADQHGQSRNAKNVEFQVYNGSSWVTLLTFQLPATASCGGGPTTYNVTNSTRSTQYRFWVKDTQGDTTTVKIRGFVFYGN